MSTEGTDPAARLGTFAGLIEIDADRYRWGHVRTEDGHYVCDQCHAREPIYSSDYILIIDPSVFEEAGKITCGNYRLCGYDCLAKWAATRGLD